MKLERWLQLTKREQLLNLSAEFERARILEREGALAEMRGSLTRAIELINCSMRDSRWSTDMAQLEVLQHETERFLKGEYKDTVGILGEAL